MQEKKAAFWIAFGASVTFVFCLILGILDANHYLDPVLDFLGIP